MSMENEDCQIDVVHALQDVIEIVLKYLDRRDLNSMSVVCKSWRVAVLRENVKRHHIQYLRLSYENDTIVIPANKLQAIPYVSIFFIDENCSRSLGKCHFDWGYDLVEELKKILPNETLVFNVHKCFSTHGTSTGEAEQRNNKLTPGCCDILGLFLPNAQQHISVRAAYIWKDTAEFKPWKRIPGLGRTYHKGLHVGQNKYIVTPCEADRLAKELGLDDCKYPKSTILVIDVGVCLVLPDCIFELCEREQQNGKEVTWAFLRGQKMAQPEDSCPNNNHERNSLLARCRQLLQSKKQKNGHIERMVLRISGPSVESWSTFIFQFATSDEIERKLLQLKERVKRKRYCIGLFFVTECICLDHTNHPCGNTDEMISRLKRIFPGIPFMGSFDVFPYPHYKHRNLIPKDDIDENDVTKSN